MAQPTLFGAMKCPLGKVFSAQFLPFGIHFAPKFCRQLEIEKPNNFQMVQDGQKVLTNINSSTVRSFRIRHQKLHVRPPERRFGYDVLSGQQEKLIISKTMHYRHMVTMFSFEKNLFESAAVPTPQ